MERADSDMSGKVCMVTGANAGIGRATALGLAEIGARVVMVCRNPAKGEATRSEIRVKSGNEAVDLMIVDLSSQQAIRSLAGEFADKYKKLDVLVNNAGILSRRRSVTEDGIERSFAVNHLAYFLLTNLLLDLLKSSASARVVNVSSQIHSQRFDFGDIQSEKRYDGTRAYSQSKLANVLFTYELARRLEGTGVTANCLHPGVVRTKLLGGFFPLLARPIHFAMKPFFISPEKGARTSLYLASSPEVEGVTGKYFVDKRPVPSSAGSYDKEAARLLWQISDDLTGHKIE